jgi:hypothetical protein
MSSWPNGRGERCRWSNDVVALSAGTARLTGVCAAGACREGWRESHAVRALGTYRVMV